MTSTPHDDVPEGERADAGTTTKTAPPPPDHGGPRVTGPELRDLSRLRRSTTDRKIAGVAAGLARHFDIDPLIVRVAFVVALLFSGAGLLLYVACWALIPDDDGTEAKVRMDDRSRSVALVIAGVIAACVLVGRSWDWSWLPGTLVIGALVLWWMHRREESKDPGHAGTEAQRVSAADDDDEAVVTAVVAAVPPPIAPRPTRPPNPRKRGPILFWITLALIAVGTGLLGIADLAGLDVAPSAYPAVIVGICAAMLLLGSFFGRAGGLIAIGLMASLALAGALAADKFEGEDILRVPATAAGVESNYAFEAGQLTLDLTKLQDPEQLDGRTITLTGDIGEIRVIVPQEARVLAKGNIDVGGLTLFDVTTGGFDIGSGDDAVDSNAWHGPTGATPTFTIDATLDLGHIEVLAR